MRKGLLTGKPFSENTVTDYRWYMTGFFERETTVSYESLKRQLARVPVHQFSKREHLFKAVICFTKYLLQENVLEVESYERMKMLKPKRKGEPKRPTVNQDALTKILSADLPEEDRLIVLLIATTGLRASECCALQWEDIDLGAGFLRVTKGKGDKPRVVGVTSELQKVLGELKKTGKYLLRDKNGRTMKRHGLYARLRAYWQKLRHGVNAPCFKTCICDD